MKKQVLFFALVVAGGFLTSGCVVRTYQMTKDRVDQDLTTGNRGYLMGQPPAGEETRERRATRTTQVVEIEIGSPIKFEKKGQGKKTQAAETAVIEEGGSAGNRGYLTESVTPPALEPATSQEMEKYTVQKNDTLQKISKKFYGTTKKWTKIYEANKDTLKGPDKIYPGKVITIPKEGMIKEQPTENLK